MAGRRSRIKAYRRGYSQMPWPGRLCKRHKLDIVALHPKTEIGHVSQRDDDVPVGPVSACDSAN